MIKGDSNVTVRKRLLRISKVILRFGAHTYRVLTYAAACGEIGIVLAPTSSEY